MRRILFRERCLYRSLRKSSQQRFSSESQDAANLYCIDLVKQHDYDNYLAGLLFPKSGRDAFFAIRAFNVELAVIKDQAKNNALAGRIRFQWWRELLDRVYATANPEDILEQQQQQQPVAKALAFSIKNHNLTARWFERSLEARYVNEILQCYYNFLIYL